MARDSKEITEFYLPWTIPAFTLQPHRITALGWYSLRLHTDGWPGWVNLGG